MLVKEKQTNIFLYNRMSAEGIKEDLVIHDVYSSFFRAIAFRFRKERKDLLNLHQNKHKSCSYFATAYHTCLALYKTQLQFIISVSMFVGLFVTCIFINVMLIFRV